MTQNIPDVDIHLTRKHTGNYVIAVSLHNRLDKKSKFTGGLLSVSLSSKFNGDMWSPSTGATTMAEKTWIIESNETVTKHYEIPTYEEARQRARKRAEKIRNIGIGVEEPQSEEDKESTEDVEEPADIIVGPEYKLKEFESKSNVLQPAVSDEDMSIIASVSATIPCKSNYSATVEKMYDLRTSPRRALDSSIPDESSEALSEEFGKVNRGRL